MAIQILGTRDADLEKFEERLTAYQHQHPEADIVMVRRNDVSVHIRIVDPAFAAMGRVDRHDYVWDFLDGLSDAVLSQLSILLLLAPDEVSESWASRDFDRPLRSRSGR